MRLFFIPGAPVLAAKFSHDVQKLIERFNKILHDCILNGINVAKIDQICKKKLMIVKRALLFCIICLFKSTDLALCLIL